MQSDYELVSTKDANDALIVQSEDENDMGNGVSMNQMIVMILINISGIINAIACPQY